MKKLAHPDWVRRVNLFGDTTGDPARMIGLDADKMLSTAHAVTGLDEDSVRATFSRYVDQYGIARES